MIIPDLNLLIYAHDNQTTQHVRAKQWWEDSLSGNEAVGMPWVVVLGFIRLTTSKKVFTKPLSMSQCLNIIASWRLQKNYNELLPGAEHYKIFSRLLIESEAGSNLTTDAHLAALAIEYQATLYSNDNDFARFSGLKWINPYGS